MREALRYVGHTAEEAAGIGAAKRAHGAMKRAILSGEGVGVNSRHRRGSLDSLVFGTHEGITRFGVPLFQRGNEDVGYQPSHVDRRWTRGGIDVVVILATLGWGYFGRGEHAPTFALLAKIGYNTLVQIAPDVARLAKRKILQIEK